MTLDEGLAVLKKRLKQPKMQQMTHALHQALVDGRSFSQALRDFPRIFPTIYVNLVAAGEASGALADILTRLVEHLMQAKDLRDRVQQALIYPAFLALAGTGLIAIFITFMVPQLTAFLTQNGGALPLPTRILLGMHHAITGYWWVVGLIAVGAYIGGRAFVRTDEGRITWDRFRLSLPGTGGSSSTGITRSFAHPRHADGERHSAAQSAGPRDGNRGQPFPRSQTGRGAARRHRWRDFVHRLGQPELFPELFTDMMAVGEQTGHFAQTMQTIADVYERELDRSVKIISALIPPVIIILIAILVGFVVFSILSAVFEMTQGLQMRSG